MQNLVKMQYLYRYSWSRCPFLSYDPSFSETKSRGLLFLRIWGPENAVSESGQTRKHLTNCLARGDLWVYGTHWELLPNLIWTFVVQPRELRSEERV
jgi:hypothetical protein